MAQTITAAVLLPMVKVYALLVMAGHIAKEDILSKLTELLSDVITWSLKTMVGIVLGFHLNFNNHWSIRRTQAGKGNWMGQDPWQDENHNVIPNFI